MSVVGILVAREGILFSGKNPIALQRYVIKVFPVHQLSNYVLTNEHLLGSVTWKNICWPPETAPPILSFAPMYNTVVAYIVLKTVLSVDLNKYRTHIPYLPFYCYFMSYASLYASWAAVRPFLTTFSFFIHLQPYCMVVLLGDEVRSTYSLKKSALFCFHFLTDFYFEKW